MSIADDLLELTQHVLDHDCTELQATIYRLAHGIADDGTSHEPHTSTQLAQRFDTGSGNVVRHLAVAEARVYRACCRHLLELVQRYEAEHDDEATLVEAVGTHTFDRSDAAVGYTYTRDRYEHRIHLGEGSTAAIIADKHGRPGANEDVHRRYTDGGRNA